jgi:hypothetical protein
VDVVTPVDDAQAEFCRAVEAHLCRKNEGHLVRIVGPAFEQVCGWARRGVPLSIAQLGIDRYIERQKAKGPRRRPVRIEFCEADVLDAFDEWRRSVMPAVEPVRADADIGAGGSAPSPGRRGVSLPAHLERVIARLSTLRAGAQPAFGAAVDAIVRELDAARGSVRSLRGDARQALLDRLLVLDEALVRAGEGQVGAAGISDLQRRVEDELAPYRTRLAAGAFDEARRRALDRMIRERLGLPAVAFD